MESLGWTNEEWRSFRRLRRKYKVSVAFLKCNVENINRFLLYVTAPRFRLKRVAERRKRGRVVLMHNCFTRMIFDPRRFKVIKERKRNVKKWSSSVVAYLRKTIAPIEFVESTYFYDKATAEPEDVRKQMKEQLELLKSGKRVVPLITGTISPDAEDSKDERLEASDGGGDTSIEDLPDDISVEGLRLGDLTAKTEKDSSAIPGYILEANGSNQIVPKETKPFIQRVLESKPPQGDQPMNGLRVAKPAQSKHNESKKRDELERGATEEATTKKTGISPETSPVRKKTPGKPINSTGASGDETESLLTPIPPPGGGARGDKVSFLDMLMTKVGLPASQVHSETSAAAVQVRNEPIVDSADDDAQICDFEESQKPGMLLTPIVPQRSKSKGANAAFFSESLNEYMRENLLATKTESDDESSPVARRKHRQANLYGLVTPDCRPPFMEMPLVPERLQKLRTVAERRNYLQKFSKNQKLAIINNEAMIYRELQRRVQHKHNKAKLCSQAIQQSLNSRLPFTRDGWQAVNFLTTDYNNYYYQVIRVDGEDLPVRLPGVRGNNDAPEKRPYHSRWLANGSRASGCPPTCVDSLLNLKPIKSAKRHTKLNQYPMPALCKPCPLSHKPFQRPLDEETAALLLAGGSMAVVRMPLVELEVFPELGKPLPEMAKRYLQYILPHQDITREWAEFSVSTLNSPPKTMREAELVAAAAVAKGGRRQSFTFAIPYLNDRNHILVRRVIDRSEKLDESFQDAAADTAAKLTFRENLPLGDALGLECADILTEMINSVAISCSENSFVKDDPDGVNEAVSGSGKRADSSKLLGRSEMPKAEAKSRKQSRLLCELKRLNATIIDAAVLSEPVESKPCLKEYCSLGCVCQSLTEDRKPRTHCGKPKCIFECSCKGSGMSRVMRLESDGRSITTEDAFNLRRKATARLARMEKEFTSTVVLTGNETLLINESQYDKKRRCTKMPKRYEDGEDFLEDARLHHTTAHHGGTPSPGKGVKSGSVVTIDAGSEAASASSGGAAASGMVMAEIAPVQYNEPEFVAEEILDQLKHCTVDVVRFADCRNMEVFCMVHELYKCFCNGRALEGKPLVIEKEEAAGEAIKSEAGHESVGEGEERFEAPAKQTRGRYSFQQVEDRVPTPIFRTPPRKQRLDESEAGDPEESDANISVGCTVAIGGSESFVACDSLQVSAEAATDDEIAVENCASGDEFVDVDYLADDSRLEVPKKPTTETVSRGRRRIHPPKPSVEEQAVISGFFASGPSGCRRVVAVPRNVYTRLNRKRATCVVTQMHQMEGAKTKKLLDEHISRSAYCHKNDLERRKKEREEKEQQRQLLKQQQQALQQEGLRLQKQHEKRQLGKQEKRLSGGDKAGIRVKQWKDLQQTTIKREVLEEGEEEESFAASELFEEGSNSLESAGPRAATKRSSLEAGKAASKRQRLQRLQDGGTDGECDSQLLEGDFTATSSAAAPETTAIKMPRIASCFSLRDLGAGNMIGNLPASIKPSALEVLVPEVGGGRPRGFNRAPPRADTPPFQEFYNGVIKNINTLVTKKMHDIDVALKRESLVVPAPSSDNLCIIRWSNFCSAFKERFVYIWDVRMQDENYLAATVRNVMPMVPNALGVVNIAAAHPQQLPVMAHFLLGLMRVKPSEKLAVVMQGRCTYWKVKGFLRQQPENACARPTPKTHPKLARKINVLCDLLVKQRVAEHRKSMATSQPPAGGAVLPAAVAAAAVKSPLAVNAIAVAAPSTPAAAGLSLLGKNVLMQHRKSLAASGGSSGAPVVRSVTICNKKQPVKLANSVTSAGRVTIPAVPAQPPPPQPIFLQQHHHQVRDVLPPPIMPKECPQLKTNIQIRKVRRSDIEDIVQPEHHSEDHRWLVLDLRADFTHIFVPDFKDLVSLDRIRKVMSLSQVKGKIVKLQFFQNAPYDAFVTPNSQTKLYFGPLKLNMRPPTLILMRRIGNQMLLREVYQQENRLKVEGGGAEPETTAFWMLQIKHQIKYEFESADEVEEGGPGQAEASPFVASLSEEEAAAAAAPTATSNESDDEDDCFIVDEVDESDGEEEEAATPPPPQGVQSITIQRSPRSNKLQVTFNKAAGGDAAASQVPQLKDFNLPATTSVTQVPRDTAADSEPVGFLPLFSAATKTAADKEKKPTYLNAEVEMIPVSDELDEAEPSEPKTETESPAKARAGDEKAALKRRITAASQKLEAKRRRIVLSNDFGYQIRPQVNAVAAEASSPQQLSEATKATRPTFQKPFRVGAKRRSASPSSSSASAPEAPPKAKKPASSSPQRRASICVAGRQKSQGQQETQRNSVGSEQKDALLSGEAEYSSAVQKVSIGGAASSGDDVSVSSSTSSGTPAPASSVVNPNKGPPNGIVPSVGSHSSIVAVPGQAKKLPIMVRKAQKMGYPAQSVAPAPSAAPAATAPRLSLDSNVKKPIFNIKHAARPSMPTKLKVVGPATMAGGNVVAGKIVIGNGVASQPAGGSAEAVNRVVIKGDGSVEMPVKVRGPHQNPGATTNQLYDSSIRLNLSGSNPPKLVPLLPKPSPVQQQQQHLQQKKPVQPKPGGDQVDYGYFVSSIVGGPRFVAKRIRSEFIIKIPYTGGIMQLSGMSNVNCSLNDLMYKHEPHLLEQLPCSWRFQAHDRLKAKAALIHEQKNPAATSKQSASVGPAPQPPKVSIGKPSTNSTATTSTASSQAASGTVKVVPMKSASVAPPAIAAIAKPTIQKTVIVGDSKNNYTIISSTAGMATYPPAPAAVAAKAQATPVPPQTTSSNAVKVANGNNVVQLKIPSSPTGPAPTSVSLKKDIRKEVIAITGQVTAKQNGGSNMVIDID